LKLSLKLSISVACSDLPYQILLEKKEFKTALNLETIVFFPHNPYPPRTGAHKRCLEILSGLKKLGCNITLISSTLSSETKWDKKSIEGLCSNLVEKVYIYQENVFDHRYRQLLSKYYKTIHKGLPINSSLKSPPGMRSWFRHILREKEPNLLVMNYAYWDGLINHQKKIADKKIIDTHDIISINKQMWQALNRYLKPGPIIDINSFEDAFTEEGFFKKEDLRPDPREFKIYDQYNYTIAISNREAEIVRNNTHKTKVLLVKMTSDPYFIENNYNGCAIYPTGPNPFNIQGCIFFIKKVLPKVLKKAPTFKLQVTGYIGSDVLISPSSGVLFIVSGSLQVLPLSLLRII